jgi:glycosyltransferase involved in cell wall biosynthesis
VGGYHTMRHQLGVVCASDAIIAQTQTERTFYAELGVPPERIPVVGPGVDPAEIVGGDGVHFREMRGIEAPVVAYVGAMAEDKGTVQVVEGVRRLWKAGVEVELVLAGTILRAFQHYLDELPEGERGRIRVLGPIDESEKRDLLAAADMVAMPSRTDSFGIAYLEAWLYRKPVIGAQAWGIGDVIEDGRDGLLVPYGDAGALAEAVSWLLDHPTRREEMGAYGEAKVYREHTWATKHAAVRDVYARLTAGRWAAPSARAGCDPNGRQ